MGRGCCRPRAVPIPWQQVVVLAAVPVVASMLLLETLNWPILTLVAGFGVGSTIRSRGGQTLADART